MDYRHRSAGQCDQDLLSTGFRSPLLVGTPGQETDRLLGARLFLKDRSGEAGTDAMSDVS